MSELIKDILLAKARVVDDLEAFVRDFQRVDSYAETSIERRDWVNKEVAAMAELLNLPDNSWTSMRELRAAGYHY